MMESLQISIEGHEERAVMYLSGRLSIETAPALRVDLRRTLRSQIPPATIAIDLAAVSYMDTAGIATLIEGLKVARIAGTEMHLQGLQGRILQLFQATGIGSLFDAAGPTGAPSGAMVP